MSGVLQQRIYQIGSGYEDGDDRINRINYEIEVLQALRERLRSKEI